MHEDSRSNINGINFWMENIMNISEATRKNKLAEILEGYANNKSRSVFIIQNSKKKEAAGVITSVSYHLSREKTIELLESEVLRLSEEILSLRTKIRTEEPVVTFASALESLQFDQDDLKDMFDNADEVKID